MALGFSSLTRAMLSISAFNRVVPCRLKATIDRSRVPVISEEDIEEQFVKGQGPGGQSVNKTVNCVVLCHKPTGVVVRCHESRLQHQNRKMARKLLVEMVDDFLNGEMSVRSQKNKIDKDRRIKAEQRAKKLREKKRSLKEQQILKETEEDEEEGIVDRWTKFQRANSQSEQT